MSASLFLQNNGNSSRLEIKGKQVTLGRHPDCEVCLKSNTVSRYHARITVGKDEQYRLEDLGSGNGTFVNNTLVKDPVALQSGDQISIGPFLLEFSSDAEYENSQHEGLLTSYGLIPSLKNVSVRPPAVDKPTILRASGTTTDIDQYQIKPEIKLKAILEISRTIASATDLDSMAEKVLEGLFHIFPAADRGCILLRDRENLRFFPKAIRHRRDNDHEALQLSRTVLKAVTDNKTGVLSADAANDERFEKSESVSTLTIRSILCAPMLGRDGGVIGIINLDTQLAGQMFSEDDLELLMVIAGQAALSYESARLMISHVEKQRYDNEMEIAARVQRGLLPEKIPQIPGYEFFVSYEAARAVGGDYYDFIQTDDSLIWFALGDVAGKGVPASLVMSRVCSAVRSTVEFVTDVTDAVHRINHHIDESAHDGRFITFILGQIDLTQNLISFVNAGHLVPLLFEANGMITELTADSPSVPLGVMEDYEYKTIQHRLKPGERLILFTDGVTEAMNLEREQFGIERLKAAIRKSPAGSSELGSRILRAVKKFVGQNEQYDDLTLVVIGRDPAQ
ncbi:SpoIIE family protein phosphatase [uncultured Gimesia sp.]|jgi:phosphoserine phosphatase RsbU/P|uniref:SpoIIE family protein phosphatase n=1 Tax=uncultured Gimesia sp. TaxID=1678688 RepID=UPI00260539DC|nr:SpoIIE family protein phosphatase [uncultured Gimesia sp.]